MRADRLARLGCRGVRGAGAFALRRSGTDTDLENLYMYACRTTLRIVTHRVIIRHTHQFSTGRAARADQARTGAGGAGRGAARRGARRAGGTGALGPVAARPRVARDGHWKTHM